MLPLKVCLVLQVVVGVSSLEVPLPPPVFLESNEAVSSMLDKHHGRVLAAPGADKYGNQDTNPACLSKTPALCQDSGGYTNYKETAEFALVNWARIDPDDYKTQHSPTYSCTVAKRPPLYWDSGLSQASRQQSWILTQPGCSFQHDTCSSFCSLYGDCGTFTRIGKYASGGSGENIAAGGSTPLGTTNQWLKSAGHCKNIFSTSHTRLGVGYAYSASSQYRHYWTQNMGRGSTPYSGLKIASGSHITSAGKTTYFVSYYGSAAPKSAKLVLGGETKTLASSGSDKSKTTYHLQLTSPTACQNYHFEVEESDGNVLRHPVDPATDYVTYGVSGCTEPKNHPTGNAGPAVPGMVPTKKPTTKQPITPGSPTKKPTTKKPTAQGSPTKKPTTKKPTVQGSPTYLTNTNSPSKEQASTANSLTVGIAGVIISSCLHFL